MSVQMRSCLCYLLLVMETVQTDLIDVVCIISWDAANPMCGYTHNESPINIDLDADIKDSDECQNFKWKVDDWKKFKATNNGHSISLVSCPLFVSCPALQFTDHHQCTECHF